jgi:hypothetical protein
MNALPESHVNKLELEIKKYQKEEKERIKYIELLSEENQELKNKIEGVQHNLNLKIQIIADELGKAYDIIREKEKEIQIEREYNLRFRNENRELKNEICMLKTELKNRISLETGNMLKQDLEDYKNMLNSRGKDVARLEKENQELKEYIQKLADKIEYEEDKELLKALESADERFKSHRNIV